MAAGVVLVVIGFILMAGGKADSPDVFSEEIFSQTKITVAPITVLLGYAVMGFGILKKFD